MEKFNSPAGVVSLPHLRRGKKLAIKVRKVPNGRSAEEMLGQTDCAVRERVEEKRRKKRFACPSGMMKRIYFLTNSYKELTFALVDIGGSERVISPVPFLSLVLDSTRSAGLFSECKDAGKASKPNT